MEQIMPGFFGKTVAADTRRLEFDWRNEEILARQAWPELLFIGDSITQLFENDAYFQGVSMVNRGIGGDEMQYLAKRFAADALQLHPKICILLAGINDSWNMDLAPELQRTGESLESTLARVRGYFEDVFAQAKAAGQTLVVGTILPVSKPYDGVDGIRNDYVRQMNEFLCRRCGEEGFPVVDCYGAVAAADGSGFAAASMTHEGVHPTAEGYAPMAERLRAVLQELGVRTAAEKRREEG